MTVRLRLVVGLGNPGREYEKTRHNAGFMTVDNIAEAFSISLDKRKFNTVFGKGVIEGVDVILAKPMAFMNKSGPPVQNLAGYFKILYTRENKKEQEYNKTLLVLPL